jgi:hypothetical protein
MPTKKKVKKMTVKPRKKPIPKNAKTKKVKLEKTDTGSIINHNPKRSKRYLAKTKSKKNIT